MQPLPGQERRRQNEDPFDRSEGPAEAVPRSTGPLGKLFPPKTHMNAVSGLSLQIYEGETYRLSG